MHATVGCVGNEMYYLIYPRGPETAYHTTAKAKRESEHSTICGPAPFEPSPGLDGSSRGNITVCDLITGSVNTSQFNGNQNGAPVANPTNPKTLEDLQNQTVTTPGYISLPVCSPTMAWAAWGAPDQVNIKDPSYPCLIPQSITDCHSYTFDDTSSSASPSVTDCQDIVINIHDSKGEWTTGIGPQREVAKAGNCKFGIQNSDTSGDVTFKTGSQDIINIINRSVAMYGGTGVVGAKGTMTCSGDVKDQKVK